LALKFKLTKAIEKVLRFAQSLFCLLC